MLEGAKSIGAGAATIALAGAAVGIGNVLSSSIHSVARNPSLAKQSFGYAILGFARTTTIFVVVTAALYSCDLTIAECSPGNEPDWNDGASGSGTEALSSSIPRDENERVKALGIGARLAIIPQEIGNLETQRLELQQILDDIQDPKFLSVIQDPLFLSTLDPELIKNPQDWMLKPDVFFEKMQLDVRDKIRILEMRKRELLKEQQSLIVRAVLRGDRRNSNKKRRM